ncbi:hypothetical protein PTSG_00434 [Salpingoeca rosetta]|uniref:Uncharacterized protein n=1 Tax=Salpingoeca rosetta (strain ATCC 50818 / BSB-021) TaxID=946362 RepID=F2TWG8_SALR5|nr:uncharacterized protein PTSG_00434 [Salpingoeca rosetta]EGD72414.1 hypothetical protein PTSG_00434 [Salpingoeca rosetta]|eukprot:XP_004998983.1 hypothetical protein PTSG_00434 [Salpingoeca rosetta]
MSSAAERVVVEDGAVVLATVVRGVKNMGEVLKGVRSGALQACFIKASMVPDLFVAAVAARHALEAQKAENMTTRNVNTEILYSLYPGRQITTAFATLGPAETDTDVLVMVLATSDKDDSQLSQVLDAIDGTVAPVSELHELYDAAAIAKLYGIKCEGRPVDDIVNDVVTKMALKGLRK